MPDPLAVAVLAALDYILRGSVSARTGSAWAEFFSCMGMDEETAHAVVGRLVAMNVLYDRSGALACDASAAAAVKPGVERLVKVQRRARPLSRVSTVGVSGSHPRQGQRFVHARPTTSRQRFILRCIANQESVRAIAARLNRHPTVVSEACIKSLAPRGLIVKDPETGAWRVTAEGARLADATASEGCPSHPDTPDGSRCSSQCPRVGVRLHKGYLYAPWRVSPDPVRAEAAYGRLGFGAVPLKGWTKWHGTVAPGAETAATAEVTTRGIVVRYGALWGRTPADAGHEALRRGFEVACVVARECGGELGPLRFESAEFAYVGHAAAHAMKGAGIGAMERVHGMWWDESEGVPELETGDLRVAQAIEATPFEGGDVREWLARVAAKVGV